MRQFIIVVQALTIWLSQLALSNAASFNCRPYLERRACPELLICSEPSLSRLDEVMASLYFEARSKIPDEHLTGFRDYQRDWLARRAECGCNYQCLDREYREQINGLRKTINEMSR